MSLENFYVKKSSATHTASLVTYTNGSGKFIYYEKFSKCVYIGKGVKSPAVNGFASNMMMRITVDELNDLSTFLLTVCKHPQAEHVISRSTSKDGQPQLLVIEPFGQGGSRLVRKKAKYDAKREAFVDLDNECDDAEPVDELPPVEYIWEEEFAKFYFSARDNLYTIGERMLETYRQIHEGEKFQKSFQQQNSTPQQNYLLPQQNALTAFGVPSTFQQNGMTGYQPNSSSIVSTLSVPPSNYNNPPQKRSNDDNGYDDDDVRHGKAKRMKKMTMKKNEVMAIALLFTAMKDTSEGAETCCLKYSDDMNTVLTEQGCESVDYVNDILKQYTAEQLTTLYNDYILNI